MIRSDVLTTRRLVSYGIYGAATTWLNAIGTRVAAHGRKRLLIVDDDESLLTLVRILLSDSYEVETALDGRTALDQAVASPPDLIVLDLRMPGMDGRALFRELRARNIQSKVLILSAYGAEEASIELRAEAYLAKPFLPDVLMGIVQRLLA
jgi:DNA-binding response OmpR family regulator